MKTFLRENPTLAFGIGLPLLIVLVFLMMAALPSIGAIAPKYAVVFATDSYPSLTTRVENGKAHFFVTGDYNYSSAPNIYLYDPSRGSVRKISVIAPQAAPEPATKICCVHDYNKLTPIFVPEIEALTLDASSVAPDGYEFARSYESGRSDPFFGGLFFGGGYYHNDIVLKKGGYKVPVPRSDEYYYGNARFIGWVIPR